LGLIKNIGNKVWKLQNIILIIPILLICYTTFYEYIYSPRILPHALAQQPTQSPKVVSIVLGASSPNNAKFYDPAELHVNKSDTVLWKNNDFTIHTVTSGKLSTGPSNEFNSSSLIRPGETFSTKFDHPKSYDYYCTLFPFMTGKVVVNP
jgi:plastocyanin